MPFEFVSPSTLEEAIQAHADGAQWYAGGTDVIPGFKAGLVNPKRLVNLKRIDALRGIWLSEDGLHLGALVTLNEVASHPGVVTKYQALAQACEMSASPQIRNVATIAGNLCQDSRCPYYREGFPCYLGGGEACYVLKGENRRAAVIGYRDCAHVHPSDPAVALMAYDAEILVSGPGEDAVIPIASFFTPPQGNARRMNVLRRGQVIREIRLPNLGDESRSEFVKAMDRAAWAFALVSAAVRLELSLGLVVNARVVLGGVAPLPWREMRVEKALMGTPLTESSASHVSAQTLLDASPLSHNRYKLRLARALVKRALLDLLPTSPGSA
jgi:xanthine dehydrogenase YagS FAD-binding subunit